MKTEDAVDYIPMWVHSRYMVESTAWRGVITKNYAFSMSKPGDSLGRDNYLYDRVKDPYQLNNLFKDPKYKTEKEKLETLTYSWMDKFGDKFYGLEAIRSTQSIKAWQSNYTKTPKSIFENANSGK